MRSKRLFTIAAAIVFTLCSSTLINAQYRPSNRLTGTYQLEDRRSDNPNLVADRVARNLPPGQQQRLRDAVLRRLEAPDLLTLDVQGRVVTMASSRSRQVTFEADGRAQTEQSRNGRSQRTTTSLIGQKLIVSTTGDRTIDYQVTFEPIDNGRGLRVTRSITDENLRQPVVARSVYVKTSDVAEWDNRVRNNDTLSDSGSGNSVVPRGTQIIATLNDNLNTKQIRDGDRFTLTVQSPSSYNGATIEGHVVRTNQSGRVAGRAEMSLTFDRIRMRDGRGGDFAGYIESVQSANGDTINVDNEGRVKADDSQTERTVTRSGIGAAIGAVIGAIADGGKGAAIGAAVGAGAGAGSVFVQGRDDLDLIGGTEFRLRTTST